MVLISRMYVAVAKIFVFFFVVVVASAAHACRPAVGRGEPRIRKGNVRPPTSAVPLMCSWTLSAE